MKTVPRVIERERITELGRREEASYRARTPKSAELHARARQSLPLGVASSFQAYDPYPLFMTDARGSRIWDADGNEYIDFDMAFGVLAAGHSHPVFAEVLRRARGQRHVLHVPGRGRRDPGRGDQAPLRRRPGALLELGHRGDHGRDPRRARFHRPREDHQVRGRLPRPSRRRAGVDPAAARADRRRLRACDRARFGRSAALAGRGDGRRAVQQPRGARGDPGAPRQRRSRRSSSSRCSSTSAWSRHSPVSWSASASWPRSTAVCSSSTRSRPESCWRTAARPSGSASKPDLFCLAKSIGGGVPIGAFGGRAEVMRVIEKLPDRTRPRTGTALEISTIPGGATRVSPTWARSTATRCRWQPASPS